MANFSSSEDDTPLVFDNSVVINLAVIQSAPRILRALRRRVVLPEAVISELELAGQRGQLVLAVVDQWKRDDLVVVDALRESACPVFEQLISGSATDTLDDGEAATLAHALDLPAVAVIDEQKAHRIAGQKFPSLRLASTTDVLLHARVVDALGQSAVGDALFEALTGARMRVLPHNLKTVVGLLGTDRAALCHSLPRSARN